jgi:hypothetical protein
MATEKEIQEAREKLHNKMKTIELIEIKENVKRQPLRERMKVNKETYNWVYSNQKETMLNHTRRKFKLTPEEAEELFKEYWDEFLLETVSSIRQFMQNKGYDYTKIEDATQT